MRLLIISTIIVTLCGNALCNMESKNSTEFCGKYEAIALPQDSTPPWSRTTSGKVTNSIVNNMLVANSTCDGPVRRLYWANSQWASLNPYEKGFTIEFSFRVISSGTDLSAFFISVGDGHSYTEIKVNTGGIIWNGLKGYTAKTADTTARIHTLRIANEATTNAYYVWYDNELIVNGLPGKTGTTNRLWFGDWSSSAQGSYEMDYVRWTEVAYLPVPEPATAVLVAFYKVFAFSCPETEEVLCKSFIRKRFGRIKNEIQVE